MMPSPLRSWYTKSPHLGWAPTYSETAEFDLLFGIVETGAVETKLGVDAAVNQITEVPPMLKPSLRRG